MILVGFIFNIYNICLEKTENKLKQLHSLFLVISFLAFWADCDQVFYSVGCVQLFAVE